MRSFKNYSRNSRENRCLASNADCRSDVSEFRSEAGKSALDMPAGYSKRSLVDKLGIRAASRIAIIHPPEGYDSTLGALPQNVSVSARATSNLDFIQAFFIEAKKLNREFPALKKALNPNGMLWISWPKKAANTTTDLNENVVRDIGLANGLVDIKVCAVDETWSGLKFVYRKAQRGS